MYWDWLAMTAGLSTNARGVLMETIGLMICQDTAKLNGTVKYLSSALRCSETELCNALKEISELKKTSVTNPLQIRYKSVTGVLHRRYTFVTSEEIATITITLVDADVNAEKTQNERIRVREAVRKSREKSKCYNSVTESVTSPLQSVTENKEAERKEKENFSPTTPLKEKVKKGEETRESFTHTVTTQAHARTHEEDYPKTTDDVLDIVKSNQYQIGMSMTFYQAEEYFSVRTATDWYDKNRNKILPKNIPYDIKRWLLNSQSKAQQEQLKRRDRSGV